MDKNSPIWLPGYKVTKTIHYTNTGIIPIGIIFHCVETDVSPCEWLAEHVEHKASYHFAWSREDNNFRQMVPLNRRAWHAGSQYNGHFIGTCLDGPNNKERSQDEENSMIDLMCEIEIALGRELEYASFHRIIDKNRDDPRGISPVKFFGMAGFGELELHPEFGVMFRMGGN